MKDLVLLLLLGVCAAMAQDPRGTISGQVTDTSGAIIPGVTVKITNATTGVAMSAVSNSQGQYEAPYLLAGTYRLSAEMQGFKSWSRQGVELRIGDVVRIDIQLEVGSLAEVIEVTAQAPVLEAATGSVGHVIDKREFSDLPLRGGSVAWLYALAPATLLKSMPYDGPWNVDQQSNISIAGGGVIDFSIDGVSNNSYGGATAFVPPPDMVQDVRIDTSTYDASVGHARGGGVNISLKSGTNALHGTLGTSISSGPMMTRNFFTNKFIFDPNTGPVTPEKIKANTPSVRWARYTASVGGPLVLPKLYDGRGRTFWMFGFQAHERRRPISGNQTVPTEAQRRGDFSALLALGPQYQIYDPYSTQPSGAARFRRQPLPGNLIPASQISAAGLQVLKYYPLPNRAGSADGLLNFAHTRTDTQDLYQPVVRVDHNFSERHRMFARYSHSAFVGHFDKLIPNSNVRGSQRKRPHRGAALDNVFVVSPQTILNVRYGFTWFGEEVTYDNTGWDLAEFGMPASLIRQLNPERITFPEVEVGGLMVLGNGGGWMQGSYAHTLVTTMNWNKGNHALKFGGDFRLPIETKHVYSNVAPHLTFNPLYVKGPLDNAVAAPAGQGTASLLYGIPTGGWIDMNASTVQSNRFYALFLQDDWRVSRKLTLNLGFRWEYESPLTERHNRSTRDFDLTTPNPIQAQAVANYAKAPIPEIPVSEFRTPGGLTFAGVGGNPRGLREVYLPGLMPRFGFAYQLHPRMVMRGGFGLYFGLLGTEFWNPTQPGFNQRTNIVPSLDNGMSYVASIADPFPSGIQYPLGAAGGLLTYVGRSPGFYTSDPKRPYAERWSYSLQFEPAARTVMEIGYIGSRSIALRVDTPLNYVPRQYRSTSPVRDQATIDFLSARVANPFRGIDAFQGSAYYAAANTTRAQLLKPFPHFEDLTTSLPAGSSWYNALTFRFERRFFKGLQFQGNYTWSKTMEAVSYLNNGDPGPEHRVANIDRPHRVAVSAIYELPFGRNRKFLSGARGLLNHVAGGWQVQGIFQLQSGAPIGWDNELYTGERFEDIRLPRSEHAVERWFNTANFERAAGKQLDWNIRSFPTRISAVRVDEMNIVDLSVHKNFRLREGLRLQLRGEAEGAMNHPTFDGPNTNPVSTLFGTVNATKTGQEERRIFVGLKLLF